MTINNITSKIITSEHWRLNLNYEGMSILDWDRSISYKLNDDILVIDPEIDLETYSDFEQRCIYDRQYQIYDEIEQFLRGDGVAIAFTTPECIIEIERGGEGYNISNRAWLWNLGINLSSTNGGQNVAAVGHEAVEDYVARANTAQYSIDYDECQFNEVIDLISCEEEDSITGAVFKSIDNSDKGCLILLPRPNTLAVRSESLVQSLLAISAPAWPKHLKESLKQWEDVQDGGENDNENRIETEDNSSDLIQLLRKFPKVARQLEKRYNGRNTLKINDEYDVQDLLHALLWLFYDDVREEEYSPSHGGYSSRIDFLLKNDTIGVEVKIANENHSQKNIKKELAEDKEHYRSHPDCETLICFVYDPELVIQNPTGFEQDISETTENLSTIVVVSPQGD